MAEHLRAVTLRGLALRQIMIFLRRKTQKGFFIHQKYGIWIDGELRKGEFEYLYQIGNLLNIKYDYNENDYLDGRAFVYYVGAKGNNKKTKYPNACCMRKVISLGETLEYEEALPLMTVEFVRNSQFTVLPFPFKYLREYIEQC